MTTRYEYDANYRPPFPALEIAITEPISEETVGPFHALLDTGSDITVIPAQFLSNLDLKEFRQVIIQGYGAEPIRAPTYLLNINVGGQDVEFAEVILNESGDELLLGRNVLNDLTITLNGPTLCVELVEKASLNQL